MVVLRLRCTTPDGVLMELGAFESFEETLATAQRHADRITNGEVSEPLIWCSNVSGTEAFAWRGATRYSMISRRRTGMGSGTRSIDNG